MAFKHQLGVFYKETPLKPVRPIDVSIPFVVGTAPGPESGTLPVNTPVICYSYDDFVENFGVDSDFSKYTLCGFADYFQRLYQLTPVIYVNVYDSVAHTNDVSNVTSSDIIGGVDGNGNRKGLEVLRDVFPKLKTVIGQIVAPGYSDDPTVAATMALKAKKVSELFSCHAISDIDTSTVTSQSDVAAYITDNSLNSWNHIVTWGLPKFGDATYHGSTVVATALAEADRLNQGFPVRSPSNVNMTMQGLFRKDGSEIIQDLPEANAVNAGGALTFLNGINGWVVWGNRSSDYPGSTDPISFIPIGRVQRHLGNTFIISNWSQLDKPMSPANIDMIVSSFNAWLSSLKAAGKIYDAKIQFNKSQNPTIEILNGHVNFDLYSAPFPPMEYIVTNITYDPSLITL